jgi:hypothetical protein
MSDDRYPKAREELEVENRELRVAVARLQASVGSLQATIIARETEISNLRHPKPAPRLLDKTAQDKFERPGRWR